MNDPADVRDKQVDSMCVCALWPANDMPLLPGGLLSLTQDYLFDVGVLPWAQCRSGNRDSGSSWTFPYIELACFQPLQTLNTPRMVCVNISVFSVPTWQIGELYHFTRRAINPLEKKKSRKRLRKCLRSSASDSTNIAAFKVFRRDDERKWLVPRHMVRHTSEASTQLSLASITASYPPLFFQFCSDK